MLSDSKGSLYDHLIAYLDVIVSLSDILVLCNCQANPEKPKRPISAMFIFSEEKRPKLQQERPDLSDSELTRLLARMWNELPDKKKVTLQCSVITCIVDNRSI